MSELQRAVLAEIDAQTPAAPPFATIMARHRARRRRGALALLMASLLGASSLAVAVAQDNGGDQLATAPTLAIEPTTSLRVLARVKGPYVPDVGKGLEQCMQLPGTSSVIQLLNDPPQYELTVRGAEEIELFKACIARVPGYRTEPFAQPPSPSTETAIKAPPAQKLTTTDEFGLVRNARILDGQVVFDIDRVDMLSGDEAERAAAERGTDVSNDYFLVNDNPRLRTYRLSRDASIWGSLVLARTIDHTAISVETWRRAVTDQAQTTAEVLFHLQVDDGLVVGIEEQYRP